MAKLITSEPGNVEGNWFFKINGNQMWWMDCALPTDSAANWFIYRNQLPTVFSLCATGYSFWGKIFESENIVKRSVNKGRADLKVLPNFLDYVQV